MNIKKSFRGKLWLSLVAGAALLAGCFDKQIQWFPDGRTAALLSEKGFLYLCDSNGVLSDVVATNVAAAAWFPDSTRLAVARAVGYRSWTQLAPLLSEARRLRVENEADKVLNLFKAGASQDEAVSAVVPADADAVALRLKELPQAREALGTNWTAVEKAEAGWEFVQVATFSGAKATFGPAFGGALEGISEMRVSPDATSVAYVVDTTRPETGVELKVALADGSQPPQLVDSSVAQFFDWAPDSQSLVYLKAVGVVTNSDQLRLASLTRRGVTIQDGRLRIQDKPEELVATIFNSAGKVRCLPDGIILFSGPDLHLPSTAADMPKRQQLFAFAQGTITPLIAAKDLARVPQDTSFFEVDPTGSRVSLVDKGLVVVLDLKSGALENAPQPVNDDANFLPVWRGPNELCYAMSSGSGPAQAALWSSGQGEARVISQNWPAEVRNGLLEK